jgi:hypothetical protein
MDDILSTSIAGTSTIAATVFALPTEATELTSCIIDFVLVFALILLLKTAWIEYHALKGVKLSKKKKILFWEIATFAAIIVFYFVGNYCVVLPLLFMLAVLVLWYLVQVYAR